jgi:hypothetical protein
MNRRKFMLAGAALLPALIASSETNGAGLIVHLSYTGSGTVDQTHKIYVALWESPDFVKSNASSMMPIAVMPVASKSGVARFKNIQKNPVYVSMAYDPTGAWEAKSEPPVGSSLGLYAKEPGVPAPIQLQPGKATTISVTLDDSFKKTQMGK